ncbi:MAG: hypothetical protein KGS60_10830 [Verrucomicrobia bacterium]|nr:hypothetical protein [Verrucomicrobiota bacterium]
MRPSRFLTIFLPLCLLSAIAFWFFRDKIADAVRPTRFSFLLQQSERAMQSGDTLGAQRFARDAWALQPNDLTSLHKLMMHDRKLGLGDLSEITILVYHHPESSVAQQQEILRWLLDRGDVATFSDLHQNMGRQRRSQPEIRLLQAECLARQGRMLEAVEEARAVADFPATSAEASLLLTSLLPRLDGNPLAFRQALERTALLLQGEDRKLALQAWRNLRLLPQDFRDPDPNLDVRAWIASQPDATAEDRLLGRQIELARLPAAERSGFFEEVVKEFAADPGAIPSLARWLLEIGMPDRLLELPGEPMRDDLALYSARLQAYIDTKRLVEAEQWIQKPHPEMSAVLLTSLKAAFASKAGRRAEATSLWQQGLEQARSFEKFSDCASILAVADRFGEQEIAARAVEVILKLPASELPASQSLEFLELRLGDRPELLRRFWEDLLRFRPSDPVAAEHAAFFQVIASDSVARPGSEITKPLVATHPKVLRFRTTHAMWLMREGKDSDAVAVLREAPVNWNEAPDWDRCVYTLALYRVQNVRDAQALEQGLRFDRISPLRREALSRLSKVPGSAFLLAKP